MNNKGFMLVEAVIVSTFLVAIMVGLFTSYNKMLIMYQERTKYYDIDCLYAAKYIEDAIIESNEINSWISDVPENITDKSSISQLKTNYNLSNVYLLNKDTILDSNNSNDIIPNSNNNLNDYLTFLKENLSTNDNYKYILIVERKSTENYYYNYLPLM